MSASKRWWRALSVVLLLVTSAALPGSIRAQTSAVLRIYPASSILSPTQTFNVEVWVEGVEDLYGYTVQISFPAALLQLNSISNGTFLDSGLIIGPVIDNVAGTALLTNTQVNPSTPKDGTGLLLRLDFFVRQNLGEGEIRFLQSDLVEFDTFALIPVELVSGDVSVCEQQICSQVFLPFTVR